MAPNGGWVTVCDTEGKAPTKSGDASDSDEEYEDEAEQPTVAGSSTSEDEVNHRRRIVHAAAVRAGVAVSAEQQKFWVQSAQAKKPTSQSGVRASDTLTHRRANPKTKTPSGNQGPESQLAALNAIEGRMRRARDVTIIVEEKNKEARGGAKPLIAKFKDQSRSSLPDGPQARNSSRAVGDSALSNTGNPSSQKNKMDDLKMAYKLGKTYCTCYQPHDNRAMIKCSDDLCLTGWYHAECVGMSDAECEERGKDDDSHWLCPDCIRALPPTALPQKNKMDDSKMAYKLEKTYCTCDQPEDNRPMIKCSHDSCLTGWYHAECIGMSEAECEEKGKDDDSHWLCPTCVRALPPTTPPHSVTPIDYFDMPNRRRSLSSYDSRSSSDMVTNSADLSDGPLSPGLAPAYYSPGLSDAFNAFGIPDGPSLFDAPDLPDVPRSPSPTSTNPFPFHVRLQNFSFRTPSPEPLPSRLLPLSPAKAAYPYGMGNLGPTRGHGGLVSSGKAEAGYGEEMELDGDGDGVGTAVEAMYGMEMEGVEGAQGVQEEKPNLPATQPAAERCWKPELVPQAAAPAKTDKPRGKAPARPRPAPAPKPRVTGTAIGKTTNAAKAAAKRAHVSSGEESEYEKMTVAMGAKAKGKRQRKGDAAPAPAALKPGYESSEEEYEKA